MTRQSFKVSVVVLSGVEDEQSPVEAINSVLSQETNFSVEVLIGSRTYGNRNKDLLQSNGSDRVRIVDCASQSRSGSELAALLKQCAGQYVTSLAPNESWISTHKLQSQVDRLDRQVASTVCCHNLQLNDEDDILCSTTAPVSGKVRLAFADLMKQDDFSLATAVIRLDPQSPLPAWIASLEHGARQAWILLNAAQGTIEYVAEVMATARRQAATETIGIIKTRNLVLRRLRDRLGKGNAFHITQQLSDNHALISHEMDKRLRTDDADRHRRLCFLYGRWKSTLPLRTKLSHAIRPCGPLHSVAAGSFEWFVALKQSPPLIAFLLTTLIRQPSWLLRMPRSVARDGRRGIELDFRVLAYEFSIGRQEYARWIEHYDTLTNSDRLAIRNRIDSMREKPTISVVMPVHNISEPVLREAIESVLNQLYPHWQLCIADDASDKPHVRRVLTHYQNIDDRIKCRFSAERGNISAASNAALEIADGDFVTFLDHDDELAEHALYQVAEALNRQPELDIIYSDEDRLDANGRRTDPYFKTDWNPDLLLSQNMICHLVVFRRQLVLEAGGLRTGFEGSQDHDLVLRCSERTSEDRIHHIPAVLYHWRRTPGSVSSDSKSAEVAHLAGVLAIREHLSRQSIQAEVSIDRSTGTPHYRVQYKLANPPLVTIIVPTKDGVDLLRQCVDGLLNKTDYPHLEVLIVDNNSEQPETERYFESLRSHPNVRILKYHQTFNYSAINNFAVKAANGDVICLLNNDTEIVEADWLKEMVSHAVRHDIGAVGAKLLYPDDTIQHAGVLVGFGGAAGHTFSGLPADTSVPFGRLNSIQNVSCVTAACVVFRKSVFCEVGGFDEQRFPIRYNDVDLCLKIVTAGYRIVWTPYAQLYHHESASLGQSVTPKEQEQDLREGYALRRRWSDRIAADPNMNPNVSIGRVDYRPAFPPRVRKPWR